MMECSNQTVAGLKPVSGRTTKTLMCSSNQTVAGLKLVMLFQPAGCVFGFKSDRCGIETRRGAIQRWHIKRSNQTVAGLKLSREVPKDWDLTRFKSDRCGIETLLSSSCSYCCALFKSDRCGIETRCIISYIQPW